MNARVRAFGQVLVIEAHGTGSEIERRPLKPGMPTIDIIFVEHGDFSYLDGGTWQHSHGPLLIAPSGLPQRVRFTSDWRFVLTRIPRNELLPFVPMLADQVSVHTELTVSEQAMRAFLSQSVTSTQDVTPSDSSAIDRMVIEMGGTVLRNRHGGGWHPGSPGAVLRERALAIIAAHGSTLSLTPPRIARECGVSLRHLQAVFAEAGTSVAAELRRERARIARSMLQDDRFDALSIEAVSEQSGFGSSVSMRRALQDTYQLNPKALRQRRAEEPPATLRTHI